MAIRKEKKNKMIVNPLGRRGEITSMRPFDLWSEVDRMFDNFRAGFDDLFWPWSRNEFETKMIPSRTPLLDVADLGDRYEMKVEMPGIPKDNINIEITPTGVEISAECSESKEDRDKNWLRRERSSMKFYRSLDLPEELKTDEAEAELKEGVLTVMLPKVEPKPEYIPKKVKIK